MKEPKDIEVCRVPMATQAQVSGRGLVSGEGSGMQCSAVACTKVEN